MHIGFIEILFRNWQVVGPIGIILSVDKKKINFLTIFNVTNGAEARFSCLIFLNENF